MLISRSCFNLHPIALHLNVALESRWISLADGCHDSHSTVFGHIQFWTNALSVLYWRVCGKHLHVHCQCPHAVCSTMTLGVKLCCLLHCQFNFKQCWIQFELLSTRAVHTHRIFPVHSESGSGIIRRVWLEARVGAVGHWRYTRTSFEMPEYDGMPRYCLQNMIWIADYRQKTRRKSYMNAPNIKE